MLHGDVEPVLAIIQDHDEDDADEARETFARGVSGHLVAVDDNEVVGVTGAAFDDEAESACWLSWTYVKDTHRGKGVGRDLVYTLLQEMRCDGVTRLFMSTGDYRENGVDVYAPAKRFYESLGARLEMRIEDYFEPGEAGFFYGLSLTDISVRDAPAAGYLVFDGLGVVDEADRAASLTWREFTAADRDADPAAVLAQLTDEAAGEGARFLIAAFPSDLRQGAEQGLEAAGFHHAGQLSHYYGPGVHQVYWLRRFSACV